MGSVDAEKEAQKGSVAMSARVASGYYICTHATHGKGIEIVEGVWSILKETARVQAENCLKRPWAELEQDGYALTQGEFWSYP